MTQLKIACTSDPAMLAEYINRTYARSQVMKNSLNMLRSTSNKAVRLMIMIGHKYHLK